MNKLLVLLYSSQSTEIISHVSFLDTYFKYILKRIETLNFQRF